MAVVATKPHVRKRKVVGWREQERKRLDIRAKHRPPPVPPQSR